MKPAQWIGSAVVLAMMVFGITFALMNVDTTRKPTEVVEGPGTAEQLTLTFPTVKQPPEPEGEPGKLPPPIDVEARKKGWSDFWFENTNEKPVIVGLQSTSCSCAGADVFLLPLGSKMVPGTEALVEQTATASSILQNSDQGVTVHPKQVGWVRLHWTGERQKSAYSLTLWLNAKEVGPFPTLEARVRFHEPMEVEGKTLSFDVVDASALPREVSAICWSVTRREFEVSGEIVGERTGAAERLMIGKQVRLSEAECAALAERIGTLRNLADYRVSAAYRIPVTLRDRADDGTPIDAGPFRRKLALSLTGDAGEPLILDVVGTIRGDVTVLGLVAGRIDFSSFHGTKGSTIRKLTLQSVTGTRLEVDRVRTAPFLKVDLAPLPAASAEVASWQMTVKVRDGAISGRFPRDKPAEYRDSAVYVRPADDPKARATRIAVEGTAIDD